MEIFAKISAFVAVTLFTVFLLFILYTLFVYAPVRVYNEADCLSKGFPKGRVSVGLERYCLTLEGSIVPVVEHQK